MESENLKNKLFLAFEFFNVSLSNDKNFIFKPHSRERKLIENFTNFLIGEYHGSIGEEWLYRYFVFQYEYWRTKKTRLGSTGLAQIAWIIGKDAYSRWEKRQTYFWYFCQQNFLKFNSAVNFTNFSYYINKHEKKKINQNIEDIERKRYLNTQQGLIHCLSYTNLFNPNSEFCIKCNNSVICKKIKSEI